MNANTMGSTTATACHRRGQIDLRRRPPISDVKGVAIAGSVGGRQNLGKRVYPRLAHTVGPYPNPPEHALVLSCDEKIQLQALNPTQPGLPMKAGRAGSLTSRLPAPWDDHAVRSPEHARRPRHLDVPAPAPTYRVAEVPASDRPQDAEGPDAAPDGRQLRHAQPP